MASNNEILNAIKELQEGQKSLQEGQKSLQEGQKSLQQGLNRLANEVGDLKGLTTLYLTRQDLEQYGNFHGFNILQCLNEQDIDRIIEHADNDVIQPKDSADLMEADIIAIAMGNANKTPCYLVIEVSYKVDKEDTDRAIRRATYLERLTNTTAHAIVSGASRTETVDQLVQDGKVKWHRMLPSKFMPR